MGSNELDGVTVNFQSRGEEYNRVAVNSMPLGPSTKSAVAATMLPTSVMTMLWAMTDMPAGNPAAEASDDLTIATLESEFPFPGMNGIEKNGTIGGGGGAGGADGPPETGRGFPIGILPKPAAASQFWVPRRRRARTAKQTNAPAPRNGNRHAPLPATRRARPIPLGEENRDLILQIRELPEGDGRSLGTGPKGVLAGP